MCKWKQTSVTLILFDAQFNFFSTSWFNFLSKRTGGGSKMLINSGGNLVRVLVLILGYQLTAGYNNIKLSLQFSTQSQRWYHQKSAHTQIQLQCPECHKVFVKLQQLEVHLRSVIILCSERFNVCVPLLWLCLVKSWLASYSRVVRSPPPSLPRRPAHSLLCILLFPYLIDP